MEIEAIGRVRTCFGEKFAVPRQPGLCPSAWGRLEFHDAYRSPEAVRGLEGFSHVWLVFGFHLTADRAWSPTVRPPRLGGNERVGVFASRSTFRPNGLGLSLVKLEGIDAEGPVLHLGGVDLVDGTPIYDVKPYLPYAESLPDAVGGFAPEAPDRMPVETGDHLADWCERDQRVVVEALSLDPRPAAGREEPDREFGAMLCGRNVRFRFEDGVCRITGVS
ncbi:tRNA (N6-threonylcarbamoyladenosine(37)-N6)-methyltransferase TrmO [Haloferula sp. A504]|uniref:tRNA (N6-threonylcarbamoyladenosine(37)-N6)-methyltransferase TrmO n=1 Tax=Haloferula sp. A504 TaxID=3373601 RepID=UPI0031C9ADF1|nr:tRNA (N6-threonylcarbamoyladenosine(37)-N6)-methyltransferase TrmO [Verrucomicrobiaceae bacterium E54]